MKIKDFFTYYVKKLVNIVLRFFWIFPVKKDVCLFTSFWGKQYSCNPKYICEFMHMESNKQYKYVWAIKKNNLLELPEWIITIRIGSLKYYYYRLFSKIIITNCGEYPQIPVRKNQLLINTWHGGGCYKKCGLMQIGANKSSKYYQKLVLMAFHQTDVVLSNNRMASEEIFRQSFDFKGEILEVGYPRNDILFEIEKYILIKEKVIRCISLQDKFNICLYAPTYRDDAEHDYTSIDYKKLIDILKCRFGGEWIVLYRGHQFMNNKKYFDEIIDVTEYPDMQELLITADVFITDYSSAIWDYQLLLKPAFIFASDLNKYLDDRGFYLPIEEWGVPIASNMEQLSKNILEYETEVMLTQYKKAHEKMGDCEDGHANEKLYKYIISCNK